MTDKPCCHHWIIESPQGPTSRGICRRCGAKRTFSNASPDGMNSFRQMGSFDAPNLKPLPKTKTKRHPNWGKKIFKGCEK